MKMNTCDEKLIISQLVPNFHCDAADSLGQPSWGTCKSFSEPARVSTD